MSLFSRIISFSSLLFYVIASLYTISFFSYSVIHMSVVKISFALVADNTGEINIIYHVKFVLLFVSCQLSSLSYYYNY